MTAKEGNYCYYYYHANTIHWCLRVYNLSTVFFGVRQEGQELFPSKRLLNFFIFFLTLLPGHNVVC
jgi:hypothetical protein